MSLSLRSVRYFIAVAEAESVTGATQSLNISQSVITDAIKGLETACAGSSSERCVPPADPVDALICHGP
jgi:hypothetical protein